MSSLAELIAQKKKALAANNRKKTAKIPEGTSRWRFYPSWRKDSDQFWHDFGQHFIKNAAGDMQAVYVCVDKTFGKPCEICDTLRAAIKGSTDDGMVETLKEATAGARILMNGTHLDGPNSAEVEIAEMPPSVFEQVLNIITEWMDAGESPLDPLKGKDFIINRTGKGKNTKYGVQVAAKRAAGGPADPMSKLNNLDDYVAQESDEAATRALTSVRTVAGLLGAPSRAGGVAPSRLAAPAKATTIVDEVVEEEDPYAVATPPSKAKVDAAYKVDPAEITDVPDLAATAAAAAVEESSGDPELDELLKKLG